MLYRLKTNYMTTKTSRKIFIFTVFCNVDTTVAPVARLPGSASDVFKCTIYIGIIINRDVRILLNNKIYKCCSRVFVSFL